MKTWQMFQNKDCCVINQRGVVIPFLSKVTVGLQKKA